MTLYTDALASMERELFPPILESCGWNLSDAADRLGIQRSTLRKKLKGLGITRPDVKMKRRPRGYTRRKLRDRRANDRHTPGSFVWAPPNTGTKGR